MKRTIVIGLVSFLVGVMSAHAYIPHTDWYKNAVKMALYEEPVCNNVKE